MTDLEDQALEWKCPKCPVKSNKLKMLHKHIMKQHKEEDPIYFECHICNFQTFIKTELEVHVESLHRLAKLEHPTVNPKEAPQKKIKVHHTGGVEDIRCDLCFFKTKSPTGINIHFRRMHGVSSANKFKCDQCEANLRTPQLLNMHRNKVHGSFKCDTCVFKTNSEKDFKDHMTKQHIKDQFQSILRASYKRRASEMCHVSPEKERKLKRVTFKGLNQDPDATTSKEFKEMEQTLIAAMQTIESLEGQNSELHAKIDHIGQLAMVLEDLKEENSQLKTCEHCKFEFKTVKSFREHMCNRQIPQNIHCVIEIDDSTEFQSLSKSHTDIVPSASPTQEEAQNITYKCRECSFKGRSEEELKQHKRDEKSAYRAKNPAYLQDKSKAPNQQIPTLNSERADLLILASGKTNGHTREGPQNEPVQKIVQVHCALDTRGELLCSFQCNSKEELQRHITKKHALTCTDCPLMFNNVTDLAAHMTSLHKQPKEGIVNCKKCEWNFGSKAEMKVHMKEAHKSYKPCKNFPLNKCEYNEDCTFDHIILQEGQHVCFRCGHISNSKTEIMNHIKEKHGNIICQKFLKNQCSFHNRCLFQHVTSIAQNVQTISNPGHSSTSYTPSPQDFPDTLTMRPVVGMQGRSLLTEVKTQDQQLIQAMNSQMIMMMHQMTQIQAMLGQMKSSTQTVS